MARAFLIVMDSVGIGGAPDAAEYFNDGRPDTGANTLAHIAAACAAGQAEDGRSGPLRLPHLDGLGLSAAVTLAHAPSNVCPSNVCMIAHLCIPEFVEQSSRHAPRHALLHLAAAAAADPVDRGARRG